MIFSLRRPDVLAVGDLGVQKGLVRWALAAHSALPPTKKAKKTANSALSQVETTGSGDGNLATMTQNRHVTPPPDQAQHIPPTPFTPNNPAPVRATLHTPNMPSESTLVPHTRRTPPPVPASETLEVAQGELPPPTPEELLAAMTSHPDWDPNRACPLGDGLSVELLRSRLSGKKAK